MILDALSQLMNGGVLPSQSQDGSGVLGQLLQPAAMRDDPLNPNVTTGAGGGGLVRSGGQGAQTVLPPASEEATKLLAHTKGDLAHALAMQDGRLQLYAGRYPEMHGYHAEIKDALIRQANPAEIKRLGDLELLQERLGGELYGGEPRGLINWLRSRSPGGAIAPPTIEP